MIHEPPSGDTQTRKTIKNGPLIDERDKRVGTGFDDPEFKTDLTDIIDKEDNECLFAFYNIFKAVNYLVILGVSSNDYRYNNVEKHLKQVWSGTINVKIIELKINTNFDT